MSKNAPNNTDDVIDSRDVIERLEELQAERDEFVVGAPDGTETPDPEGWARENPDDAEELAMLESLAEEGENYAPDWRYGEPLVRDSYFKDYAQELAEDCGMIDKAAGWPARCIDWDHAAEELKMDYTAIEFGDVTYWVRS